MMFASTTAGLAFDQSGLGIIHALAGPLAGRFGLHHGLCISLLLPADMVAELLRLYPALCGVQVVRSWAIPTAFTPDDEPLVGWLPERDNLFVAAAYLETITAVPVVSEWMAGMILGQSPLADLSPFARETCTRCGRCVTVCAYGARELTAGTEMLLDEELCRSCGLCVAVCAPGALTAE